MFAQNVVAFSLSTVTSNFKVLSKKRQFIFDWIVTLIVQVLQSCRTFKLIVLDLQLHGGTYVSCPKV